MSPKPKQFLERLSEPGMREHYRGRCEEFRKAGDRIIKERGLYGVDRAGAMAWLLEFVYLDLAQLGRGGFDDKEMEVRRFSWEAGLGELIASNQFSASTPIGLEPLTLRFVQDLQHKTRSALSLYADTGRMAFLIDKGWLTVVRPHPPVLLTEQLESNFFHQAAHVASPFGERVKRCGSCAKVFLAGRTDKRFCSNRCQAKHYVREERGTPPERFGKRGRVRKRKPTEIRKKGGPRHGK